MRYYPISQNLFIKNREKLLAKLPYNSIAILHSNDKMPRNGDLFYPYRQHSDFFYLTGISQENSILVLVPFETDSQKRAILFISKTSAEIEIWEGKKIRPEEASEISGITTVYFEDSFTSYITKYLTTDDVVFLNKNENPRLVTNVRSRDERFARIIRKRFPHKQIERLAPLLWECRIQKEPEEIALIEQACTITKGAFLHILPHVAPGVREYRIEALLTEYFLSHGSQGHAFEPIIAGGKNSCYLHYNKNNELLQKHDILLMDFGAEYANYASDCSRTIPVNGTFSPRQKAIYSSVLKVLQETKKLIVPGNSIQEYHKQTCLLMQEELLQLGLLTQSDIENQSSLKPAYFTYFMHGVSHFMGLDTHDVGNKETILKPGMIVTCEPGIYVPQEGIGIRLENDILLTENGNRDLMEDIPIEIDDIETRMHARN